MRGFRGDQDPMAPREREASHERASWLTNSARRSSGALSRFYRPTKRLLRKETEEKGGGGNRLHTFWCLLYTNSLGSGIQAMLRQRYQLTGARTCA